MRTNCRVEKKKNDSDAPPQYKWSCQSERALIAATVCLYATWSLGEVTPRLQNDSSSPKPKENTNETESQ